MSRLCPALLSTCAAAGLVAGWAGTAGAALAQEAQGPASPPGPVSAWLADVLVDGRVEAGATFNPASPDTGVNFGQLFTDKANQFVLNQVDLRVERAPDVARGRFDVGFAVEGMYGMDSQFTHFMGIGDQGSTGRNSFDLVQANLQAFVPLAHGVGTQIKAGLFLTPMGYEALDPRANFFYSNSYIFNFGLPRKGAGVLTTTHLGQDVDIYLGYDTGVNGSVGPGGGYDDGQPHVLGGVALRLGEVSVKAFTHIGAEDTPAVLPPGVDAHKQLRFYDDLVLAWPITPRLSAATELNYLKDNGLDARAGGVAQDFTYEISPRLSAGVRAEVWRDGKGVFVAAYPGNLDYLDAEEGLPNGAFHPGPATYGEVTLGLNIRPALSLAVPPDIAAASPFGALTIRPEIRYDRVLAGDSGFGSRPGSARDQVTFAVDVVVPLIFQRPAQAGEGAFASQIRDEGGTPAGGDAAAPISTAWKAAFASAGPGPLQALGHDEIDLTNPQTIQDLNGYAPNATLATSATGQGAAAYVRGLGDWSPHSGQAPAVGLTMDGVQIDGALAQMIDPWDLASMQVAYGPSGLDAGRDASAGAIVFDHAAPARAWGLDAGYALEQGFHANDERVRLNAPVGDTAGLELSVSHRERGGYDNDLYSGQTLYGRQETTLGRAQFDWSVTPDLEASLAVAAGHMDGQGAPLALGDTLDAQLLGPSLRASQPRLQFNANGSPYLPGMTSPLGRYQTAADQPNGQSLTAQVYSLTLEDRSALGQLTSITAYVRERQDTAQDLDGGCALSDLGGQGCGVLANPLVGALDASADQTYAQFTQELRLDRDFGGIAQARVGAFFIHDETSRTQLTRTSDDPAAPSAPFGQAASEHETSYAAFAGLTLHPASRLAVSGTARYVVDQASFDAADASLTGLATSDASHSGRLLSKVTIEYQATDAVHLFADRATGFRPGGLPLATTLSELVPGQTNHAGGAALSGFAPETDVSYEAGLRASAFDGRLTARLTGFLARIDNLQAPQIVLTPGFGGVYDTYVLDLPRAQTKGVEADLAYRPLAVPGLTLSALGGFEDARITDGVVPAGQVPVIPGLAAGAAGASVVLTGAPMVQAPRFDGVIRADYVRPLGPGKLLVDASYAWTDRYALADLAGQGDFQPAYGSADVSFGYARGFYRITVTARNILNATTYGAAIPAFFSHAWGDPRTVVVSLEANF